MPILKAPNLTSSFHEENNFLKAEEAYCVLRPNTDRNKTRTQQKGHYVQFH